jgi:hypothetical protein
MTNLHLATIITAGARRFRATVRLSRDGRLLDRVPVNGGIGRKALSPAGLAWSTCSATSTIGTPSW